MTVSPVYLHFVGDYITQSNWMATEKVKRWLPAALHGTIYTLPFALLTRSPVALVTIGGTHMIIDHYRLAKHVIWTKNHILSPGTIQPSWAEAKESGGFGKEMPAWMSTWLMILTDNIIHVTINDAAIRWL